MRQKSVDPFVFVFRNLSAVLFHGYFLEMPIFYECDRCTACCRWPGQVKLGNEEISRLAAFKNLSEFDFIQTFTRLTSDRKGLALADKTNGECIFLQGNDCAVNDVKPKQCRAFPNLWNFPGFEHVCRARPREVSKEEFNFLTQTS